MEPWHLTKRFFGSLVPSQPSEAEESWLVAMLTPAEERLYRSQPAVDRCHSIDGALTVRSELGAGATRQVIVAAALHDVGKAEADLGVFGRVCATVVGTVVPVRIVDGWRRATGFRRRVVRYLDHDVRGAELLMEAGSDPLVVAWAREHHEAPSDWTIDRDIGAALKRADG